ncbi:Two-component sensor protein yhcY [Bacillus cereus Rock4-18]|nr:Two-component sensor protein yhcY [Bacillus cereus Rock4-18]
MIISIIRRFYNLLSTKTGFFSRFLFFIKGTIVVMFCFVDSIKLADGSY